jgi:hypothetical protein
MFSATEGWLFAGLDNQPRSLDQKAHLGPSMFRLTQGRWVAAQTVDIRQRRFADLGQPAFLSPNEFWALGSCIWWTGMPVQAYRIPIHGDGFTPIATPLIVHYHNGWWDIIAQ